MPASVEQAIRVLFADRLVAVEVAYPEDFRFLFGARGHTVMGRPGGRRFIFTRGEWELSTECSGVTVRTGDRGFVIAATEPGCYALNRDAVLRALRTLIGHRVVSVEHADDRTLTLTFDGGATLVITPTDDDGEQDPALVVPDWVVTNSHSRRSLEALPDGSLRLIPDDDPYDQCVASPLATRDAPLGRLDRSRGTPAAQ
jgi:hypothetical protein